MISEKNLILNKKQVMQIIKRMAYEIYEDNYKEKELFIAGIDDKGYLFAQMLMNEFKAFNDVQVRLIKVSLDKVAKVQPEVELSVDIKELKGKAVVVADDVLNSGRAIIFSLKPFLSIPLSKLQTAVIVDRNHKTFPVSTDFAGYSLATTLKEHIEVNFDDDNFGVYLH